MTTYNRIEEVARIKNYASWGGVIGAGLIGFGSCYAGTDATHTYETLQQLEPFWKDTIQTASGLVGMIGGGFAGATLGSIVGVLTSNFPSKYKNRRK